MLALGSAILQGITRNPMIAPDLTGMTSIGCLLIVACDIFFFSSPILNIALGTIGAMIGFLLCFSLTRHNHTSNQSAMVLIGICISFSATAWLQLLLLKAPQQVDDYLYFLSGSLYATPHQTTSIILILTIILVSAAQFLSHRFAVLSLDDASLHSIGVPIKRFRVMSFIIASLLIGASVVGVGNMGFLGIVAPNLARFLVGNRPPSLFLLTFLIGGTLYLLADIIGRSIISPAEIPAGMMCNIIAAPLFLIFIFRLQRD
jgi:iron complex transport system permease protein